MDAAESRHWPNPVKRSRGRPGDGGTVRQADARRDGRTLHAAALVIAPLWAPLVLAAWFADLLRPAVRKLERVLGGRRRAAGALVVLVVVGVLLPLVGIGLALATAMQDLLVHVRQVRAAIEGQGSLASALLGGGGTSSRPAFVARGDMNLRLRAAHALYGR